MSREKVEAAGDLLHWRLALGAGAARANFEIVAPGVRTTMLTPDEARTEDFARRGEPASGVRRPARE